MSKKIIKILLKKNENVKAIIKFINKNQMIKTKKIKQIYSKIKFNIRFIYF